jgi:hypothetical protein
MMRCTICNKFIMPLIAYTYSSAVANPSNYCQCSNFVYTHTFTAPPLAWSASLYFEAFPQPEEEKPLEWSEVEQQLDTFMETLNGRDA